MTEQKSNRTKSLVVLIGIVLMVVALDQLSKYLILAEMQEGEVIPVMPGLFNLVLVFNKGVAFGMFSGLEDSTRVVVLSALKGLALLFVFYFLFWEFADDVYSQICMSLILGGAMGNIIDRFLHGAVVDFLDFYYGAFHWHAFNVADSAISVGVTLLLLGQLRQWWIGRRRVVAEGLVGE
jgi:signal peptidase II